MNTVLRAGCVRADLAYRYVLRSAMTYLVQSVTRGFRVSSGYFGMGRDRPLPYRQALTCETGNRRRPGRFKKKRQRCRKLR